MVIWTTYTGYTLREQRATSYGFWQQTKYPWTGLGYTYDWYNANTHVGASEYVVRSGSTINVTGKIDRATYCTP